MISRLLEKIELWIRHRADRMPYTAYCYWCDKKITARNDEILEVLKSHFDHPSHKAAKARKERRDAD